MRRLVLALALILPCGAQTLRLGGGAAPMENVFKPVRAAFQARTGIAMDLRDNGPEQALLDLAKGDLDGAAAGLSPAAWMELMASRGHAGIRAEDYQARTIGLDRINVFLHGDLALLTLDRAELKGLFTGAITNWKAVGGPDLKVTVVLGTKVPGTNKVWQEQVLEKAPFAPGAVWVGATPEILATLAATPGGIGIGPLSSLKDMKLTSPVTPEVGRPITLLTRGTPGPDLLKLLAFLEGEGKALTAK